MSKTKRKVLRKSFKSLELAKKSLTGTQQERLKKALAYALKDVEDHFKQKKAWPLDYYLLKADIEEATLPGLSSAIFMTLLQAKGCTIKWVKGQCLLVKGGS